MSAWLGAALAGLLAAGVAPGDPNNPPEESEPNEPEPDPEPVPEPEPDPPREPPQPDPPAEPEPVPPPEPGDGGGGGDGGVEPEPSEGGDGGGEDEDKAGVAPAPFAQLDVADRGSEIELGGDLTIGPVCGNPQEPFVCNNYRVGLRAQLPITQSSATGTGRAAADSLNGLSGAWRAGGVFDWIRDVTAEDSDSPSKFYMLTLKAKWGVQTFRYQPDRGATDIEGRETRHSVSVQGRFLAYIYPPRKTRVAPQVIVRYDRHWADADTVGVLVADGDPDTPDFTVPAIIDRPRTTPVFAVTVPVLVSIQSGKKRAGKVLSQFGLGPAISYAAAGGDRGYNPFDQVHLLRFESWIYWYPVGKAGQLATRKPNARVGISPFVDVFVAGRDPEEPRVDFGVLAEVKVGVRGYEY